MNTVDHDEQEIQVPEFNARDHEILAARELNANFAAFDLFYPLPRGELLPPQVWKRFFLDVLNLPNDETTAILAELNADALKGDAESLRELQRLIAGIFLLGILNSFQPTHPVGKIQSPGLTDLSHVDEVPRAFQAILTNGPLESGADEPPDIATLHDLAWRYIRESNPEGPEYESLFNYLTNAYKISEHVDEFCRGFRLVGANYSKLCASNPRVFNADIRPIVFCMRAIEYAEKGDEHAREFRAGLDAGTTAFAAALYNTYW